MLAAGYSDNTPFLAPLLPVDPVGQRFIHYFHHGWGFIHAPMPAPGDRPEWRTETRYPLEPRNLWSQYQDEEMLLGLRFAPTTQYMLMDMDAKGQNHPANDRSRYDGILATLEDIGLCRPIPVQSSDSGGLHVYYFLPWEVESLPLAVAAKQALEKAGYRVRDGELELYPNAKPHNPGKPTNYRAHRLPLQKGSCLLDWDLQPISGSVSRLLDRADAAAKGQDMEALAGAMTIAQAWCNAQYSRQRGTIPAEQFCFDLEEIMRQGWTGYGQTNNLLIVFAKYGIIFRGLSGEDLVQYMLETVVEAPGYKTWCRHQHHIEQRIREWARCAESYSYTPYCSSPPRDTTYAEHFGGAGVGKIVPFSNPSQQRHVETVERVASVIALLKEEGAFPDTAYLRTQAIIAKSKEVCGIGGSQTTLHKPAYKALWHPAYEDVSAEVPIEDPAEIPVEGRVNADGVSTSAALTKPCGEVKKVEPPQGEADSDLHVPSPYEGIYAPARAGGAVGENPALTTQDPPQVGRVVAGLSGSFKKSLRSKSFQRNSSQDSSQPPIIQISSKAPITQSKSNPRPSVAAIFQRFLGKARIDKRSLYPLSAAARGKNSQISDNQPLSIAPLPANETLKPLEPPPSPPSPPAPGDQAVPKHEPPAGRVAASLAPPAPAQSSNAPTHAPGACSPARPPEAAVPSAPPATATTTSVPSPATSPITPRTGGEGGEGDTSTFTPEQYRHAIKVRLKARPQAQQRVMGYAAVRNISVRALEDRPHLEQLAFHLLLWASDAPMLQQEADAWFATVPTWTEQMVDFLEVWAQFSPSSALPPIPVSQETS